MSTEKASAIAGGAVALATFLGGITVTAAPASGADVLGGETIRILAIGDPVFQVMQKIHGQMEEMAGGKIQLEVRPFDVLRQQVLLNAQNATSNYDIIAIDLRLPDRVTVRLSDAAAQARADALKDKKPKKKGGAA